MRAFRSQYFLTAFRHHLSSALATFGSDNFIISLSPAMSSSSCQILSQKISLAATRDFQLAPMSLLAVSKAAYNSDCRFGLTTPRNLNPIFLTFNLTYLSSAIEALPC